MQTNGSNIFIKWQNYFGGDPPATNLTAGNQSTKMCPGHLGDHWGFPWYMLGKVDTACVLWLVILRPHLHCTPMPFPPHIALSVRSMGQRICASLATPSQAWARLSIHFLYHSTDRPYNIYQDLASGLAEDQDFPGIKKMLKVNNLGDTNELTLHEVDSLHSKNCKMEWKAGSFYRLKNREKQKQKISECLGPHCRPCLGWEGTRNKLGVALAFGDLLLFSCSIMSDSLPSMDCSPPGFSVHGIPQARTVGFVWLNILCFWSSGWITGT